MPQKLYKILIILGIVIILLAVPAFWLSYPKLEGFWNETKAAGELEVDFFDIGQGDSILIKTPMGQNVLIDGGPDNTVIERLSEVLPWWDRTIDLMILTHPHDDHVFGLIDVIKRYNVKKIIYTGVVHSAPAYIAWLELIRDNQIPLVIIDRPQIIELGDSCKLDIMYPLESLLGKETANLNNSSLVMKLIFKDTSFLLTGDAEMEVENLLAETLDSACLRADVLKVGHHGSDTSSSEEFLQAIKPEVAVIQVGKENSFGHPSRRVIKRLERIGAKIYRNDLDGTVKIISDGEEIEVLK
ncbi:MBL fold metallo-hydrolase [Candidatus Falkowbacteria bacterium]|nr:MAG: MBL fold metallo-hydrolase [Candidatus Falkowbacteria bacterium]